MHHRSSGAPHANRRHRRRSWARRVVGTAALLDVLAVGAAPAMAAAPPSFTLDVQANQATFQVAALKPGPVGQRCLVLRAAGGSANSAQMSATVDGTGLASYLDILIERGPAASAGSCASMATSLVFAGSLGQFAAAHPSGLQGVGIALDAPSSDATVRITISLRDDNGAQGLSAGAVFSFQADDTSVASTPTPTSTNAPDPVTSVTTPAGSTRRATGTPSTPSSPSTTAASTDITPATAGTTTGTTPPGRRTTTPTTRPTTGSSTSGRASVAPAVQEPTDPPSPSASIQVTDPTAGGGSGITWSSIPEAVKTTVTLTAKATSVPALFLGLVFIFLLLQDRIDRNDPKLARAPMRPDPELVFLPRHEVAR